MSHLPRPTSAASTSSSSGIGTLPSASKIPKPGFNTTAAAPTSTATDKNEDNFKVGDKVRTLINRQDFPFDDGMILRKLD